MSSVDYEGRVAVVTGAGGGLGREYALMLARHGARVVVNDLGGTVNGAGGGTAMADAVVTEIESLGGEAVANYDSVSTSEGGAAVVQAALDRFGQIDALIHNAGILRDRTLANLTPEEIDTVLDVHLRGGFHVTVPAFKAMKERGYGRIVLTSSSSGLLGNFGQANYGAAKTGLVGLMHVAAIEGARYGILANCISPGASTRMTKGLLGDLEDKLGPEQVAAMTVFLASPQCQQTHEIYSAGGGRFARYVVAVNDGWYTPDGPAEPDQVLAHLDQIRDIGNLHVLGQGAEELTLLADIAGRESTFA